MPIVSTMHAYNIVKTDGGRSQHFKGTARDCVTRAIAIASGHDYIEVYDLLSEVQKEWANKSRSKAAKKARENPSARDGVFREAYHPVLTEPEYGFNFEWIPLMGIGTGCTVHTRPSEVGLAVDEWAVLSLSGHLTAVDGEGNLYDRFDPTREGTRCVYGKYVR